MIEQPADAAGSAPSELSVPKLDTDASTLDWALALAKAGWYVGPARSGTKNPGSVLGGKWNDQTSREPEVIVGWFAGTDYSLFIHAGRSGALMFDVDRPEAVPDWMRPHFATAPMQTTRPDDIGRGHYLFAVPAGKSYGNGLGNLPKGWGEIRGKNGVIMVEPSVHPEGGEYRWRRHGALPMLPDEIAQHLTEVDGESADTATDAETQMFLDSAVGGRVAPNRATGLLTHVINKAQADIDAGVDADGNATSRHDTCVKYLSWAMDDAAAGLIPAAEVAMRFDLWFADQFDKPAGGYRAVTSDDDEPRDRPNAGEFQGILAWCVGQAMAKTDEQLEKRRQRILGDEPEITDIEGMSRTDSSDLAMALWFLYEKADEVCWVPELGYWLVWDGVVWRAPSSLKDRDGEVSNILSEWVSLRRDDLAVAAGQAAYNSALERYDDPTEEQVTAAERAADKAHSDMVIKLKSATKHKSILSMVKVRGPRQVGLSWDRLDADPYLLNAPNGMIDLRTGALLPHDPAAYCTNVTAVAYDPSATAETFLAALEQAQPDPEVRAYLQRRGGSSLIGEQLDHVFHVDYGERGRNGKGLHDQTLFDVVGSYGGILSAEKLMVGKFDPHPEWIMRLRGKRYVWIDEGREQRTFDSARVKAHTGGATRECRDIGGSTVYYRPSDTTVLSTNRMPRFDGGDEALEGRMRIVSWDVTFIGAEDTSLANKIKNEERAGVLAWMVAGCIDYLREGLNPPLSVIESTREQILAANPVATWAMEEIESDPDASVTTDALYERYKFMIAADYPDRKPITHTQFTRDLRAHLRSQGVPHEKKKMKVGGRSVQGFTGIKLIEHRTDYSTWL